MDLFQVPAASKPGEGFHFVFSQLYQLSKMLGKMQDAIILDQIRKKNNLDEIILEFPEGLSEHLTIALDNATKAFGIYEKYSEREKQ